MLARASNFSWQWALLPLLLAATLSIPLLGDDAFTDDEPKTLFAAGVLSSGPHTLAGMLDVIAEKSSEQALGWPFLVFVWGRLVGWSELAIRALSLFFGLLALAWVYRTGRDLISPGAGLVATLLLSASVFFLAYMIHARAFTLVALSTVLCIWSYWRIVLHPRLPGRGAQAGLLFGSAGLLYAHFFCALFLPALGLFHLLFIPKNRRWWQPVLLLVLAALLAMLQLPGFLQGLDKTVGNEALHDRALTAPAVVSHLVHFITNGLLDLPPSLDTLLLISLPFALALVTLLHLRGVIRVRSLWLLAFTSLSVLALMIAINTLIQVIVGNRIRYLMPLWPLTALLAGAGLWHFAGKHRRLAAGLLVLWLISGAWLGLATEYRSDLGFFQQNYVHLAYQAAGERIPVTEALVVDHEVAEFDREEYYIKLLERPSAVYNRHRDDPLKHVLRLHAKYPHLWLLFHAQDEARMEALADVLERVICKRVPVAGGFMLERLALSPVHCPDSPARLQFEADIQLTGPDIQLEDGLLRLHAGFHSADNYLLAHYSLAVHIIDPLSGERVAQGDTGVGPGTFVPLLSEIDVSALPPGEYDLRVALYDWQTGARLPARDLVTGASGDMHTLYSFRIG